MSSTFIETEARRLQNLYLLQDVRVMESAVNKDKYTIGWVQMNGQIIQEGDFDTYEAADSKRTEIVNKLISQ